MEIDIRLENESDFRETENLTREAFWNVYKPGCDEHLIVHKLRKSDVFVKELDYVACDHARIIGNIMYSFAKIISTDQKIFEVLCLGPISVLPDYQNKGVGSKLIKKSILKAAELNDKGILLFGNQNYYSKFGFRNAKLFNVQTSAGENGDYFMGLELSEGSLKDVSGRLYESDVFHIADSELNEFEKLFPYKEKQKNENQLS